MIVKKVIAIIVTALGLAGASFAQNATPESLVDKFIQAHNSHDASAYEKLFTRDAHFIVAYDVIHESREKIVADFKVAHDGWAKVAKMTGGELSIQRLSDKIAVLYFNVMVEKTTPPPAPGLNRTIHLVVVKERNGWLISSGQISKPNCPK